jgi:hypothetical protein
MSEWKRWALQESFLPWLKSVIPYDAVISPTASPGLHENRGKAVGQKNVDGTWSGQRNWTAKRTTLSGAKKACRDGASIGMQGVVFPALDIDCDDQRLVDAIKQLAFEKLGPAPVRGRSGSSRCLLMYQLEDNERPFSKRRVQWEGQ